jgi:putative ABC transport system permease protein
LIRSTQHDPASIAHFSNLAEQRLRKLGFRLTSIITTSNEREEAKAFFDILTVLFLLMALLLAIVGGISLMGTMSINVIERTREIGVMRAVGASDRSVGLIFILEGLFIGCLSWLLGSLASLGLGKLTSDVVGNSLLGVPLSYEFSLLGVGIWLILVVIISIASSFIPARNASQLTVREVLAYE